MLSVQLLFLLMSLQSVVKLAGGDEAHSLRDLHPGGCPILLHACARVGHSSHVAERVGTISHHHISHPGRVQSRSRGLTLDQIVSR